MVLSLAAEAAATAPSYPTRRKTDTELSNTIEQVSSSGQFNSAPVGLSMVTMR